MPTPKGAAWDKARGILDAVQKASGNVDPLGSGKQPEAENARRLVKLIETGEIQDERLRVPIAAAARGSGNSTALVGTPDQVAEAIARYYDIGVRGVLIRGFDPYNDAIEYGRELDSRCRPSADCRAGHSSRERQAEVRCAGAAGRVSSRVTGSDVRGSKTWCTDVHTA